MAQTILRLPEAKARTGLSRSTIYLRMSEGAFPEPIALGVRRVGWIESEIDAWIAQRDRAKPPGAVGTAVCQFGLVCWRQTYACCRCSWAFVCDLRTAFCRSVAPLRTSV